MKIQFPCLFKTEVENPDYGTIADEEEWFQFAGTYDLDGETYYKWEKIFKDDFQMQIALEFSPIYILTDTLDFSGISAENPYSVVGMIHNDVSLGANYNELDKFIECRMMPKVTFQKYPKYRDPSTIDANGHSYVDLGLPSGTLWADRNVNAELPEDLGGYYQWASTVDKTNVTCSWDNWEVGFGQELSKVAEDLCDNGVLKQSVDPANKIMGGTWRLPTCKHFNELLDFTNRSEKVVNGIPGIEFVSKINNNTLFIPFGGHKINNNMVGASTKIDLHTAQSHPISQTASLLVEITEDEYDTSIISFTQGTNLRGIL